MLLTESGRNWHLIYLNTGNLCVMIVDYYCHFFQVIQLSFTLFSTVANGVIQYLPNFRRACSKQSTPHMTFPRLQGITLHTQKEQSLSNVCMTNQNRCKKPRTRVPKVPATNLKAFACTHQSGFWTVSVLSRAAWAEAAVTAAPCGCPRTRVVHSERFES